MVVCSRLIGAYALAVASPEEPDRLVVARAGSPLVIGMGVAENFIASDVFALLPVTQNFMFLEEGDILHFAEVELMPTIFLILVSGHFSHYDKIASR